MEETKIWVINRRGRPLYLLKREADVLIESKQVRMFPGAPPKETYYPQYDETGGRLNIQAFEGLGEGDEVLDLEIL